VGVARHLFAAVLFCASGASAETEAERIQADLSHEFCGSFRWQNDRSVQDVVVKLGDFRVDLEGRVAAEGKGRYTTSGQVTDIDVKWLIDPGTKRFEMWELNPNRSVFTTDGSHVGSLDEDLQSVRAVWTTNGTGATGTLTLTACSSATSRLRPLPASIAFAALPAGPARPR
jgi:hypothetical protein